MYSAIDTALAGGTAFLLVYLTLKLLKWIISFFRNKQE
jgi:hypothetical protein